MRHHNRVRLGVPTTREDRARSSSTHVCEDGLGRRVQAAGLKVWRQSLTTTALSLAVAVVFAFVGSAALLHESPSSTETIAGSVFVSGLVALAVGMVASLLGMQFLPRLSLKVGGSFLIGSAVAIDAILFSPLPMFQRPGDLHVLILLLLCFLSVSLGLASVVSFSVTNYLSGLREAAHRVRAGHFDTRIEVPSRDEFSELAIAMNRMSEELGHSFA